MMAERVLQAVLLAMNVAQGMLDELLGSVPPVAELRNSLSQKYTITVQ